MKNIVLVSALAAAGLFVGSAGGRPLNVKREILTEVVCVTETVADVIVYVDGSGKPWSTATYERVDTDIAPSTTSAIALSTSEAVTSTSDLASSSSARVNVEAVPSTTSKSAVSTSDVRNTSSSSVVTPEPTAEDTECTTTTLMPSLVTPESPSGTSTTASLVTSEFISPTATYTYTSTTTSTITTKSSEPALPPPSPAPQTSSPAPQSSSQPPPPPPPPPSPPVTPSSPAPQSSSSAAPSPPPSPPPAPPSPSPAQPSSSPAPQYSAPAPPPSPPAAPVPTEQVGADSLPLGITWDVYTDSSECKSAAQIASEFSRMKDYKVVRIYGKDCDQIPLAIQNALKNGQKLMGGAYMDTSGGGEVVSDVIQTYKNAIDQYAGGNWDVIQLFSVENERVNERRMSAPQVVEAINTARSQLRGLGYNGPVGATETAPAMINNPSICEASDVVMVNVHAFFDRNTQASDAGPFVKNQVQLIKFACNNKRVVVAESGWPRQGNPNGAAIPSPENQRAAIASIRESFSSDMILFSAFDSGWKVNTASTFNAERFWGII